MMLDGNSFRRKETVFEERNGQKRKETDKKETDVIDCRITSFLHNNIQRDVIMQKG